jgi:hypothetical protein
MLAVGVQAGMKATGLSPQLQCAALAACSAAVAIFIYRNTKA